MMEQSTQDGGKEQDSRMALSFTISVTVGVASAIIALGLVISFWMWPSQRELIVFAAGCFGGAAAVTAAVYAGRSLELSARQQKARLEEEKRLAALRFVEQWNSPHFFHGKKTWRLLMRRIVADQTPDRVQAVRKAFGDSGDQDVAEANLLEVLNFFEGLALGVRIGAVDGETAEDFFRTIVRRTYEHLDEWIKERRREGGPRVYQELEGLYERWKA